MNFVNYVYSSWLIQALMNWRTHRRVLNTDGCNTFIARTNVIETLKNSSSNNILYFQYSTKDSTVQNLNYVARLVLTIYYHNILHRMH